MQIKTEIPHIISIFDCKYTIEGVRSTDVLIYQYILEDLVVSMYELGTIVKYL